MKKTFIFIYLLASSIIAQGWSQKGHDVTAYIAEKHLTPAARAAVDSILEGKSMVYWSNWLDNASHNMDYGHTYTWHFKNIDDGVKYEDAPLNPKGDIITAINGQIAILSDSTTSLHDKNVALKILVHCMGDLHQPMHLGHLSDLGGNKIKLKFFDRETNLHSIWDSSLVEYAHKWSYTEWQEQIDRATPQEESIIVSGSVDDWGKESYNIAKEVYVYFQPGMKVMYNPIARWAPVIETQLLRGGLRLAHLLNQIYQ